MGIITDKEMASKPSGADQWFTDPAPRGAGRFLGRITPTGERAFYFRYTTSTGNRDTLPLGNYDPKGREGCLTLAAAREKAAYWSKLYREGARDLRQHFAKIEAAKLQAEEDARLSLVSEVNVVWPAGLDVVNQTDTPKAIFQGDSFNVYARVKASSPDQLCQPITLFGRVSGEAEPRQLAQARPAFIADETNTLARLAAHTRYTQLRQATDAPAFLTRALPELAEKYQLVTDDTSFVLVKERAAGQQATDMPELRQVKHMQAAGWGGLGSVLSVQDNVSVPSVWRSSLSKSTSVSKVRFSKASTLGVLDTRLFGSLRHHIPAFLRKETDHADSHDDIGYDLGSDTKEPPRSDANWVEATVDESTGLVGYSGWTPAGYAEWLSRHTGQWPTTYAALRATELGELVVQWLEFVIGEGEDEAAVVKAFNRVMAELGQSYLAALGEQLVSAIGLGKQPTGSDTPVGSNPIAERIRADLADITPQSWPVGVLHFAEDAYPFVSSIDPVVLFPSTLSQTKWTP